MASVRLQPPQPRFKRFVWAYVLLLPFLSAFALASWLPLPMLFLVGSLAWLFLTGQLEIMFEQWDLLLGGLILASLFAVYTVPSYVGPMTVKHTVAFVGTIIVYYFGARSLLGRVSVKDVVLPALTYMVIGLSCYVVFEFVITNAFGVDIDKYIPHYRLGDETNSSSIFGLFTRPRGLAEEAGHTSLLYEIGLPLSSRYVRKFSLKRRVLYYGLAITAFIMLFSVGGILSLSAAALLVGILRFKTRYVRYLIGILCLVSSVYVVQPRLIDPAIVTIRAKLQIGEAGSASAGTRSTAMRKSWAIASSHPTGVGWGTIYEVKNDQRRIANIVPPNSTISLIMEILLASGFVGLLVFVAFVGSKVFRLFRIRSDLSDAVLVAALSLSFHYVFISNFWFPLPWFLFALADLLWYEYSKPPRLMLGVR